MTPLEKAASRNQALAAKLQQQFNQLADVGQWSDFHSLVFSLEITQQRLEQLIGYMFEPQEEVSREAFELQWEETLNEMLTDRLSKARKVLFLPQGSK